MFTLNILPQLKVIHFMRQNEGAGSHCELNSGGGGGGGGGVLA